jgi:peptide/nickel transport system substrate-binding protein
MTNEIDRRTLLARGLRTAAGAALLGVSGGTILGACGTTAKAVTKPPQKSPYGGQVNIGTWSEVTSLSPPGATWDATGYLYGNAIFDTLAQIGRDGKAYPYLAESITPNPDYTVWTVAMRPGVLFHNGQPCDAAAVAKSIDAVRSGYITSEAIKPIDNVTVTGPLTLQIEMSQPWIPFAAYLASQLGYICAPAMLDSADQGADRPIGTGPFIFKQWVPNDHLTVTKNPNYWQKGFPYLDQITFRPLPDNGTRNTAMESGTIQIMHTQAPQSVATFLSRPDFRTIEGVEPPGAEPDIDFIMFNCDRPPTNDPKIRRALVLATDPVQLKETYGANITEIVNGPFQPGSAYYCDTDYPTYDQSAARAIVSQYEHDTGGPLTISLDTITGATYTEIISNLQSQWGMIGIKVEPGQIGFSTFLLEAVLGGFEAATFEQFSATDPDQNYVWWSTQTWGPDGAVSLNIARNKDPVIQAALETGRQSAVEAERVTAYQTVAKQLAIDLPYLWLAKTIWAAVTVPYVAGVATQTLPGGTAGIGFSDGAFLLHQIRLNG